MEVKSVVALEEGEPQGEGKMGTLGMLALSSLHLVPVPHVCEKSLSCTLAVCQGDSCR